MPVRFGDLEVGQRFVIPGDDDPFAPFYEKVDWDPDGEMNACYNVDWEQLHLDDDELVEPWEEPDDAMWKLERVNFLASLLGPPDKVYRPDLEGDEDLEVAVVSFNNHVQGVTYATSGLVSPRPQAGCGDYLNRYELMMCTHQQSDWAVVLLAQLAGYTLSEKLKPGDTMDVSPILPSDSTVQGLLFLDAQLTNEDSRVLGHPASIILCIGVTEEELSVCLEQGWRTENVVSALRSDGVHPYTDLTRPSVTINDVAPGIGVSAERVSQGNSDKEPKPVLHEDTPIVLQPKAPDPSKPKLKVRRD